jgi:hypothetical protein
MIYTVSQTRARVPATWGVTVKECPYQNLRKSFRRQLLRRAVAETLQGERAQVRDPIRELDFIM